MSGKLKYLESLLTQPKMNRREFISRATALGLASAVAVPFWDKRAHAAKPQKGGRLRVGMTGASTSDSLDTGLGCCVVWEMWISFQCRNHLIEIDANGSPTPELAESWESTPDATKWIFNIRKGVEFHNGKTLDANDVVYSLNHHRGEDTTSPIKTMLSFIKDIKADGKHVVIIETDAGYADMPSLLSDYHLQIIPDGHTAWNECMGTGPYKKVSYEPGVSFFSTRNPNYWRDGRAHFDEIESIGINDTATATMSLKAGDVDVINNIDRKTAHLLDKIPAFQVVNTPGLRHYTIPMLTDVEPYNNNDARMALKYGIDREELLKTILHGYGSVGNDHPIAKNMRYFNNDLPQRKYDSDKAKFHLKKAGLEGYVFKLHTAEMAYPGAVDTAILMKEKAAKAGIKIEIVREPNDGYWTNVWRKKPWSLCHWSGRVTEDMNFSTTYAEDAAWNDTHWKHEKFNKLLKEARSELADTKRRDMYFEMQKILRDEGGVVVHLFTDHLLAATSKLRFEAPMAGHLEMDGARGFEKWWFES